MYTVTVLTPRGHRQQVKVTPNTTLLQVLEEVCTKHGFNAKQYDLRHHNQVLDVSSMFRFTNLPNNAQLEMTEAIKQRQESSVTLGLQLESGERLTGVFVPSDSVWDVIIALKPEEEKMKNVVVIYMRQEMYGKENLNNTTLRSLGLTSGRAMLRLLHKSPEQLRTQANVTTNLTRSSASQGKDRKESSNSAEPKKKETHSEKKEFANKRAPIEKPKTPPPDPVKKEIKSSKQSKYENFNFKGNLFEKLLKDENTKKSLMEDRTSKKSESVGSKDQKATFLDKAKSSQEPKEHSNSEFRDGKIKKEMENKEESKVILLGNRNAVAYDLNNVKPIKFDEEPDDFFDLTINDAKMLLQQAKQLCEDLEQAPLMTAAQRELEKDKKVLSLLHQYKKTVLRIKFPDRTVLQGTFSPVETVSEVEKFVTSYLENPKMKFYLYTTPPKLILDSSKRLIECDCVPSSVLYFGISADSAVPSHFLKAEVLKKLSTPSAAALTAFESRNKDKKPAEDKSEEAEKRKWTKSQTNPQPGPSGSEQWDTTRDQLNSPQFKFPKWFKPNK